MKVHKSFMNRNQIEVSNFESVQRASNLAWSLKERDGVKDAYVKLNMTLIVICEPGHRDRIAAIIDMLK